MVYSSSIFVTKQGLIQLGNRFLVCGEPVWTQCNGDHFRGPNLLSESKQSIGNFLQASIAVIIL
jgi:hypothetical protein